MKCLPCGQLLNNGISPLSNHQSCTRQKDKQDNQHSSIPVLIIIMDVLSSACPNASMLGKRGKVITEALFCVHLINVTVSDSPQHNCYPEFDQAEGKNGSKPGSLYLGPFLLDDVYENFSYLLLPRFQSYVNFQLLF